MNIKATLKRNTNVRLAGFSSSLLSLCSAAARCAASGLRRSSASAAIAAAIPRCGCAVAGLGFTSSSPPAPKGSAAAVGLLTGALSPSSPNRASARVFVGASRLSRGLSRTHCHRRAVTEEIERAPHERNGCRKRVDRRGRAAGPQLLRAAGVAAERRELLRRGLRG